MVRLKFVRILLLVFICMYGMQSHARYQSEKNFFFTGLSTQISDVGTSSTQVDSQLFPKNIQHLEIGWRIMNIFSLSALGQRSDDEALQGYGVGLRIDLPGFFFIGGSDRQMRHDFKKYPVNTSLFMQSIQTEYTRGTAVTKTISSRYGATIEIFPFQEMVYLSLEGGLYTFNGNSFMVSGAGLGLQF